MLKPVIRVVREGESLDTAPVYKRTIDTEKNQLKIYDEVIGSVVVPAGSDRTQTYVIVTHNLGYKPFTEVFIKKTGTTGWKKVPCRSTGLTDFYVGRIQGINEMVIVFYTLEFTGAFSEEEFDYKYIIYVDPAQDAWDS